MSLLGLGTKTEIPAHVIGWGSPASLVYPISSRWQGIPQVCFALAYEDLGSSFIFFWKKSHFQFFKTYQKPFCLQIQNAEL